MTRLPDVELNPHWIGYRCTVCGREYATDWPDFVCADCGITGILDVRFDDQAIGEELAADNPFPLREDRRGMWRFAALLPVQPMAMHPAWSIGSSPAWQADRLAGKLDIGSLVLKDDTGLPSGSLKDRAAAIAIARAHQLGIDHIACASTGNAAASLAVLAARAGIRSTIFVPATTPTAKLAQLLLHGSRVVRVDGNYDQAFDLSTRLMTRHRWYSRNCAHNPLLLEGKKTAALELAWPETGRLRPEIPDAIFVPVGDGCIISSVGKAFSQLKRIGLCGEQPRIFGVQAAGAAPLAQAWQRAGTNAGDMDSTAILAAVQLIQPETIADSISVGIPRNRVKAWRAVAESGGDFLTVTDEQIIEAIHLLAAEAGVFAEPSGAAGLAGIAAARKAGLLNADHRVAVLITGNGLKDPGTALSSLELPIPVRHDIEDIARD